MIRAAEYSITVIVYFDISLFWNVNNAELGYIWAPLDHYGEMPSCRILKDRGLK